MTISKWEQVKLLLPDTLQAELLVADMERQIQFIAQNVANMKPQTLLATPTLMRIRDVFGEAAAKENKS